MPESDRRLTWWQGLIFLAVAALVVVLDFISKEWVRSHIPPGGSLPEIGRLTIVHVQNSGAAFGIFTNQAVLLSLVAIAGLVVVLVFLKYLSEVGFAGGIALSLVFAGALGNLIDRLRFGVVTDFIYVRLWGDVFWPAFNVADSAITLGALSLAIIALVNLRKKDAARAGTGKAGD